VPAPLVLGGTASRVSRRAGWARRRLLGPGLDPSRSWTPAEVGALGRGGGGRGLAKAGWGVAGFGAGQSGALAVWFQARSKTTRFSFMFFFFRLNYLCFSL
jgi:hypothetical protein